MRKLLLLLLAFPLLLGAPSASAQSCTIDPPPPPEEPLTGRVGTDFTFFVTVSGCGGSNKQPTFRVVDGRLPRGTKLFDFAGSSGLISGVPTTAGTFTFTIQVKDENRATDIETFTIEILPPEPPTITEALSDGTVGEFYCCGNLFASGGVEPYTWTVVDGTLPPGLAQGKGDEQNRIFGTPTTAGTFTFTVRVTDDLGAFSEKVLSITIN